jgi:hypothetical protein
MNSNRAKRDSPRDDMRDHDSSPRVRPIDSQSHYHGAIAEALGRSAARPGTLQAERLDALVQAVEDYEERNGHDITEQEKFSVTIRRMRVAVGIE